MNIRKWKNNSNIEIGVVLTIVMELECAQSGVLAPTEAVSVAPRKWVKRGWGENYNKTKFPLIKVRRVLQKDFE